MTGEPRPEVAKGLLWYVVGALLVSWCDNIQLRRCEPVLLNHTVL